MAYFAWNRNMTIALNKMFVVCSFFPLVFFFLFVRYFHDRERATESDIVKIN